MSNRRKKINNFIKMKRIFKYVFIYLAPPSLGCGTWEPRSPLWHGGSLVAAFELLVAAWGI